MTEILNRLLNFLLLLALGLVAWTTLTRWLSRFVN